MDKRYLSLIIILILVSISSGIFCQLFISHEVSGQLAESLDSVSDSLNLPSLLKSLLQNILFLWLIFLSSAIPVFLPLPFIITSIKGFSYGFSSSLLVISYGFRGAVYSLITILPFAVLELSIFAVAGASAASNHSIDKRRTRKLPFRFNNPYYLILTAALLTSDILEVFLQQLIL